MRLKTIPKQRKTNCSHERTNTNRENVRSTNITQGVNEEFMNVEEYGRMLESLKIPEANRCGVPGTSSNSEPVQLVDGKYVEDVGLVHDFTRSTKEVSEAVNLSTKNDFRSDVKSVILKGSLTSGGRSSSDKFAGSLLYQIMTDPTFVESIKTNKEMKKLTCKFCKKKFVNYEELQNHLDSRLNKFDRITCCACGKTFGQKRYLRYHQRCHVVNNKFTCEICTSKFSRMDNLTRHRACHTNPDKYPCKICKKTFSRRDLMTKHSKSHEGKKVTCDLCKEVFGNLAEMKEHRLAFHVQRQTTATTELTHIKE